MIDIFRKDKAFLDEQIDIVEAKIRAGNLDSAELGRLLDVRSKLEEEKRKETKDIDWKGVIDILLRVAEIGGTLYLTYMGYKLTANIAVLSYGQDEAMTMCNGRVWNLKDMPLRLLPKKI